MTHSVSNASPLTLTLSPEAGARGPEKRRPVLALLAVLFLVLFAPAARAEFRLRESERILFLGDSNTFANTYVAYLDAYLATRFPDRRYELVNLGLASEGVTGLTEPGHPFPRPNVHDRLERALREVKPTLVVACYGMNDGIYAPFDAERFRLFQAGVTRLVELAQKAGARVHLVTPAAFDPVPLAGRTSDRAGGWSKPFAGYDTEVLARYSEWVVSQRSPQVWVSDAHTAMNGYLKRVRATDPGYVISRDGIHPDATGHWLVARSILETWDAPGMPGLGAGATEAVPLVPPDDPDWDARLAPAGHAWGRLTLRVPNLAPAGRFLVSEGERPLGSFTGAALAVGVDLGQFADIPSRRYNRGVLDLCKERTRVLGLAYLAHVGHKRPNTPAGLPLEEARKRFAELTARLVVAAAPRRVALKVTVLPVATAAAKPEAIAVQVCVYGGTPAGVTSAVQAARLGKSVVLLVPGNHVGGMTSGGLTATDVGNPDAIAGLAKDFYARVGKLRFFSPGKAEATFRAMLAEAQVPVRERHTLAGVTRDGTRIASAAFDTGLTVSADVFVDATYEGDLLAAAGVTYTVGREPSAKYGEAINGVQFRQFHDFLAPVDPFRTPGDPASGLVWGVSDEPPGAPGEGDRCVQAYNFRMFLSDGPNRVPFPKPADYRPERYELLLRYFQSRPATVWKYGYPDGPFELHAGDCNNAGGFSTDHIGASNAWPEADPWARAAIFRDHLNYQQGLMWFCANDPRVPEPIRQRVGRWGLDRREFAATGHWPHELYVREGRRLVSDFVMTQSACEGKIPVPDGVGLAAYAMDSHNCRRLVVNGKARNEGDVQVKVARPYPVSYRSITPRAGECRNLLVPVCLSASHIAYGSIRMEPVFMGLGQSAGAAASLAIDGGTGVQGVPYARLREVLLKERCVLEWK